MPRDVEEAAAREPISGEHEVLEAVAAVGRREANWLRSLDGPVGNWVSGALADAVEEATGCLDPADRDPADR
ncbi:hypothetical protein [Streptomyces griseorubiginosus]|uniref:hypothetical protein n=1 Tax=Streptomyces griseorubiginosus TaxID=67304 RepID=UPI0036E78BA5